MKKIITFCLTALASCTLFAEKITVYRTGNDVLIQSRWSDDKDIVINIYRFANEMSYLVKRNSDIRQYRKGIRLHWGSDEYPATLFAGGQGYGYLSGNHGSSFGMLLTVPGGKYSVKDIGSAMQDDKNRIYRIVQVVSPEEILIHPESTSGIMGAPKFPRLKNDKLFRNGAEVKYSKHKMGQVYPLNRVTKIEFLVDGKTPLPEKTVVKCDFLEHRFEHDVLAPEGVVEYVKKNPGKKPYPEFTSKWHMKIMDSDPKLRDYASLPAIMTIKNRFIYQQNGAVVNDRTCTFHVSFPNVSLMDQMFCWGGGKIAPAKLEEFYIPKTKPLKMINLKDLSNPYEFDFAKVAVMPEKMFVSYTLSKKDVSDQENLPDRYIRLTGNGKREYGIAIGTSLFAGHTANANKGRDRDSLYYFYTSKKMYPYSYILKNNKPGISLRTISYKQYFNPALDPDLTAFYHHRQENSHVVYVDCHKSLKNKTVQLPASLRGKKITVLEKTPSVTLHTEGKLSDGKLLFDVKDQGCFVLKLD